MSFDNYDVKLSYYYRPPGGYRRSEVIEVKLPELFKVIATEMMGVSLTEYAISNAIKEKYLKNLTSSYSVHWEDEQQLKIILNQLKVLNLLQSYWSKDNKALFWGLTEKGRRIRDDMIVRKE